MVSRTVCDALLVALASFLAYLLVHGSLGLMYAVRTVHLGCCQTNPRADGGGDIRGSFVLSVCQRGNAIYF